tara:strand:- start:1807 stop:2046 length:240 start_codon:yes stop_codon:yes gene_type:complete
MELDSRKDKYDNVTAKWLIHQISDLEKKLYSIQQECDHMPKIGFFDKTVKLCCAVCNLDLGYPGHTELQEFLKKQNGNS